jgi:multidrug resistance protein, MATE family
LSRAAALAADARRIAPLAWPVFIGQLSVVAFATVDTLLVARHGALDLAALAVGAAAYITVFIGLMGVVLAVSPIVGQLFGAGRLAAAGEQLFQAGWLAVALALPGCALLVFPQPFLALGRVAPELAPLVRSYLSALAFALPAALLFAAYRGFNTAVSRPKAVMALQLGGLALKVPLSTLLVSGLPAIGLPALGVTGCGIATAVAMWLQLAAALWLLRRDPFYERFGLRDHGLRWPQRAAIGAQLRLGLPMGLAILIEVSGFSMMAVFIARLGTTPVAGHQIAANMVSVLFMLPLAIANATSTLVAQRVGAGDGADARRIGWHGVQIGTAIALALGGVVFMGREAIVGLYTSDPRVVAAALPLLAWVALFHTADAAQCVASFVLRAWKVALAPVLIFAGALWGVGLGGGFVLAFDVLGVTPPALQGAAGYWAASTAGVTVAAVALIALLGVVMRRQGQGAAGLAPLAPLGGHPQG